MFFKYLKTNKENKEVIISINRTNINIDQFFFMRNYFLLFVKIICKINF